MEKSAEEMKETMPAPVKPEKTGKPEKPERRRRRKKRGNKRIIVLILVIVALLAAFFYRSRVKKASAAADSGDVQTAAVVRMDITSELTASSSLSPKDTYEVTSLVEGEILEANFEEGDVVEKGQILYRIDASSMDSDLSLAETSLLRAQENVQTAREDYNEAVALLAGNIYKSTTAGYIQTLYIKEGDKVGNGTKIAEIYDDSVMKLTVPFLSDDAGQIAAGSTAVITLEDTGEQIEGTVTNVSSLEVALSGGRLVKNVTIEVANPGGLTTSTEATATVGGLICAAEGTFAAKTEATLSADLNGNENLEVEALLVAEGSQIGVGTGLFQATAKSAEKYINNFQDNLESANDSLESAENKLENTQDNIEDYTITAPISGTVVTKNSKAGDKISKSSGGTTTMCVIYDLSTMTLEMSVDELDVGDVKVGQAVEITADAIDGVTFTGSVTNVSLQGSYSNGVTNYPVTVTLDDIGDLRPGMNVDAQIILDSSEQALCIPVGALMRGNRVYVKDSDGSAVGAGGTGQGGDAAGAGRTAGAGDAAQAGNSGESGKSGGRSGSDNAPEGFHTVTVETGIINDDYVEILSGLSEGDEVYVDPSAGTTTTNMFQMGGPGGNMGGPGGQGGAPGGQGGGGNRGGQGGGRP